jgi:glycine betaine catabolism A
MDAAPVPGLDPALRPFGESTMLPAAAYTSEQVLAWEWRHLFAGSWMCLGRTTSVTAGATQRALSIGGIGVVVTASDEGVRAFANTCRHRGHELLECGTGNDRRSLVCPYHGWAYDLDGSLRTAPRMGSSLEPRDFPLVELPAVDWHGWLFVNASGTARAFSDHIGTLAEHVAPYQASKLVVKARHSYEVAANWKIIVENYHECYHCPLIHPELCAVTPPTSGENWHEPGAWVGGTMTLREHAETMSLDGVSRGVMLDGVDPRTVAYVGVFPNVLISLHPDYVMTHRLTPMSASRSRVDCEWLFVDSVNDPSYAVSFWDLTNRQDWAACESVQRGVSSPHFRPGPLAPSETAIYDWVTMVARAYRDPIAELGR